MEEYQQAKSKDVHVVSDDEVSIEIETFLGNEDEDDFFRGCQRAL